MARNGKDRPGVLVWPPGLFLGGLALGGALEFFWPTGLLRSRAFVGAGLALAALGAAFMAAGLREMKRAGTAHTTAEGASALVTTGPFARSRNPLYLAVTLIYLGIGLAARSAWTLALIAPVLAVLRLGVVAREEAYLERRFGEAYRDYKRRVRRWL